MRKGYTPEVVEGFLMFIAVCLFVAMIFALTK